MPEAGTEFPCACRRKQACRGFPWHSAAAKAQGTPTGLNYSTISQIVPPLEKIFLNLTKEHDHPQISIATDSAHSLVIVLNHGIYSPSGALREENNSLSGKDSASASVQISSYQYTRQSVQKHRRVGTGQTLKTPHPCLLCRCEGLAGSAGLRLHRRMGREGIAGIMVQIIPKFLRFCRFQEICVEPGKYRP